MIEEIYIDIDINLNDLNGNLRKFALHLFFLGFFLKLTLSETLQFLQLAKFYNMIVNAALIEKFLRIERRIQLISYMYV